MIINGIQEIVEMECIYCFTIDNIWLDFHQSKYWRCCMESIPKYWILIIFKLRQIFINPYIDMWHKRVHFDYASDSLKFVVNGMFCTLNALRRDSISIRAHLLVACRNLHIRSNPHGNLCPLIQHAQLLQSLLSHLQLDLIWRK